MKQLLMVLAIVFASGFAIAEDQVPITDQKLGKLDRPIFAEFGVNKELGRAWVEQWFDRGESQFSERYPVPGLSYNDQTQEVIYRDSGAGKSVVCAIKGKPTEHCLLKSAEYDKELDDGYVIQRVPYFRLWMEVSHQVSSGTRGPAPAPAGVAPQTP